MTKRPAKKKFQPKVVPGPTAPPPDAAIVQFLYSLLAEAQAGELRSLVAVGMNRNGFISHGCVGTLHAGLIGGCAMAQARLVALIDPKQNSAPAS